MGGTLLIALWSLMILVFLVLIFKIRNKAMYFVGVAGVVMSIGGLVEMIYILKHG
ncbi:hypothetical protein NZD89_27865 (plasmid) [Alicyclobacillus fastidiosus]|uniref:DUF2759 family protein n=1 Tax=Alicyclobacillus fastidiosus TaxID=392011 RepID=A0ABY6ZPU9_9BACL|nr:hypothetical protein [Alicyclobacillus fastidiosus]WAH44866.1 hypothetical protein NZD89_27865 [Alicyclobacillus fastidiosus]GMA65622.1 hypothetical protein GCM10025859_60620 [Alicyclobacillus fastidiosus]GMA65839.1 hypothetical protein GCM10025859_62790 [Alicyclobacillus fastidiosus]